MAGPNTVNKAERIATLQIQSSAYGLPMPLGWGRGRVALNLLYLANFTSEEITERHSGKGGGSVTNITYSYFGNVVLGICDAAGGPIRGITAVYRDKSVFTGAGAVAQAGFANVAHGESGQAVPDGLIAAGDSNAALGYDTTAYLYGSHYQLNGQGGLQNHSVEVDFAVQAGGGLVDANPGDRSGQPGIVHDFLVSCIPQWREDYIGDLKPYGEYCLAANLLLSPVLDSQQQASAFLDELMTATNSACWIRGDGTLQIKPYGDAAAGGNGASFKPDLTPLYDLSDADFIVDSPGDDPVKLDTDNLGDLYNVVPVTFKNRQHQYNDETVTGYDQASVDEIGQRKQSAVSLPSIKDPTTARVVAQILAQKNSSLARPFRFTLPWCFDRLEEMDLVTLTSAPMKLDRVLVRIKEIDEDGDNGRFAILAEEVLIGTANAPAYPSQSANGVITDFEAAPGDVARPVLFIPPTALTQGALEVWAAVASTNPNWGGCQVHVGLENQNYRLAGTIHGGSRYGVTADELPVRADPDTIDTLHVDLGESGGELAHATQTEADSLVTLCYLGGEYIAYREACLEDTGYYRLNYLRRGAYGSPVLEHPIGTRFVRIDNSLFRYGFLPSQIGTTVHVKFLSFNIFGRNMQDLAEVTDYTITLAEPDVLPGAVGPLVLSAAWVGKQFTVTCGAAANALVYTFRVYRDDGVSLLRQSNPTASTSFTYTYEMALADGVLDRTFVIDVVASNVKGDGPVSPQLTVTNDAPAPVTGVTHDGDGTSITLHWAANSEADRAGYVVYSAETAGFNPAAGEGVLLYQGRETQFAPPGLEEGHTYYVRIAAYDTWSDNAAALHFSDQHSFTPTAAP